MCSWLSRSTVSTALLSSCMHLNRKVRVPSSIHHASAFSFSSCFCVACNNAMSAACYPLGSLCQQLLGGLHLAPVICMDAAPKRSAWSSVEAVSWRIRLR